MVLDTGRGSGVPDGTRALDGLVLKAQRISAAVESVIDGKAGKVTRAELSAAISRMTVIAADQLVPERAA